MKHIEYCPLYTQVHLSCSQAKKKNTVSACRSKLANTTHILCPLDTWAVTTRAQQSLAACGHSMQVKSIQQNTKSVFTHKKQWKNLSKVLFKKIEHQLCHVKEPNTQNSRKVIHDRFMASQHKIQKHLLFSDNAGSSSNRNVNNQNNTYCC